MLYLFDEGAGNVVVDHGEGDPAPLTIHDPGDVRWDDDGLTILRSTLITTGSAVVKIKEACEASDEVTLEAWATPADLDQDGPARIFSYSSDPYAAHALVGQSRRALIIRIPTEVNGPNGNRYELKASDVFEDTETAHHLIGVRRANGDREVWTDGVLRLGEPTEDEDSLGGWGSFPITVGNEPTEDREWTGTVHRVAIYCRALSAEEIQSLFFAGPRPTAP